MTWMNEYEIDQALDLARQVAPEVLPYVQVLSDWRHTINQNSDGWAYWKAGTKCASRLMDLVSKIDGYARGREQELPSDKQWKAALTPIKSCATRHNLPVPAMPGAKLGMGDSLYTGPAGKFDVGDLVVKIEYDEDPENPRTAYDNFGTMVAFHRRYNLGDETDYKANHYESWAELKEAIEKNEDPAVILPLYLHDHSGLAMRTSDFGDRWDSGQVGFIFVSKDKVKKEYGKLTKKTIEQAKKVLESEVETYSDYLGGFVYGYVVEDQEGEELDAVWGFYGLDYVKKEAEASAKALAKQKKG